MEPVIIVMYFAKELAIITLLVCGCIALLTCSFAWLVWSYLAMRHDYYTRRTHVQ